MVIALGMAMPVALQAAEVNVTINGEAVDFEGQPPTIIDGRTLVPVRGVFEALGFDVDWVQETQTVVLTNAQYEVNITIDSPVFVINGREVALDVPAQIIDGRTLLPIRAVVESIGMSVGWEQDTQTVTILRAYADAVTGGTPDLSGSFSMDFNPDALANQIAAPVSGEQIAVIHTNLGEIHLRLFPEYAPLAVENFVTHAQNGFYDGVIFHRAIENFMIQGGDPLGTGAGGESIWGMPFGDEFTPNLRHIRGALSMANAGPTTNGSQFFIVQNSSLDAFAVVEFEYVLEMRNEILEGETQTLGEMYPSEFDFLEHFLEHGGTPHLDFAHTVFGQVFLGVDVVDAIAAAASDSRDRPLEDIVIERIEIINFTE